MAEETPTTFTEEGARRLIEEHLRTLGLPRNDFPRRRRHVNLGGGSQRGHLIMFRLEEELLVGAGANARLMDSEGLITLPGSQIVVMDDEGKWFARGNPAASGDAGGDASGNSNVGWAARTGASDNGQDVYSIISCGTWARYITGSLSEDSWTVQADEISFWDGSWPRDDDGGIDGDLTLIPTCVSEPIEESEFVAIFDGSNYKIVTICCV